MIYTVACAWYRVRMAQRFNVTVEVPDHAVEWQRNLRHLEYCASGTMVAVLLLVLVIAALAGVRAGALAALAAGLSLYVGASGGAYIVERLRDGMVCRALPEPERTEVFRTIDAVWHDCQHLHDHGPR